MLEILKSTKEGLKSSTTPKKGSWINVFAPTKVDIRKLNSLVQLPADVLISVRDKNEVPTIEKFGDLTFVLIRIPEEEHTNGEVNYTTRPMGIVTSKDHLISLSYSGDDIFADMKEFSLDTGQKRELGLRMLLASVKKYHKYLSEINKRIYNSQKKLEASLKNEELLKLMHIQKSLIYFNTSLRGNRIVIDKLKKDKLFSKEHKALVDDVIEEIDQAIEMTTIYYNILGRMMGGFSSVISNNVNAVMKLLTSVTIILMIPTLISSIYGMNVALPLQGNANAFLILIIGSMILSAIGIYWFWKSKLF